MIGVWGLAWALHIPVSIPGAALVLAILGLSMMIPAGPGYIGTYGSSRRRIAAPRREFANAMALAVLIARLVADSRNDARRE